MSARWCCFNLMNLLSMLFVRISLFEYLLLLFFIFNLEQFRFVILKTVVANVDIKYPESQQSLNTHGTECPLNWTRYERTKSCFYVVKRRMRWSEAERACENLGGHLASIIDEYENMFAFNVAKQANLSTPTLWLGRLVKLTRTGAYEWNDGAIGRQADGFREPPTGTDLCLTMWLDFDRPEGSWNEWDCNYATGYSALCKRSLKKSLLSTTAKPTAIGHGATYVSRRCCLVSSPCSNENQQCAPGERCIPDDLDCWTRSCTNGANGWCLPLSNAISVP